MSLASRYSFQVLGETLLPRPDWHPYPAVADRPAWEQVRPGRRDRVLAAADVWVERDWPVLPASLYADYRRTGTRVRYERAHRERRAALAACVLAECLTGAGHYLDAVADLVWMICEETSWSYPATSHPPRLEGGPPWDGLLPDHRSPVVDLFAAETGATLAWTRYLLEPALRERFPAVLARIDDEVRRRLLVPYRTVDEWRWLRPRADGRPPSNWNPWIHSNLLAATLAVEDDRYIRTALVARIVRGLESFLDGYGDDGGCEEGVSYFWQAGARLFECLELLAQGTAGKIEAFDLPKVGQIGRFLHRMHIGGDFYVNAGDGAARQRRGGQLLYRFGSRLGDAEIQAHALAMRPPAGEAELELDGSEPLHRLLPALLSTEYADAPAAEPPLVRDCWLPDIQVLTCRERQASSDGLFLAARGGHNGENHSHNDVGSFLVALDGHPMIIDVGVGVYTKQTFDGDRYGIWTMRSAYHNVPLVDGHEQLAGPAYRAAEVTCEIGSDNTELNLDLAGAYPPEAGLRAWRRTVRLDRRAAAHIEVVDDYEFTRHPGRLSLHLMTCPEPHVGEGRITLAGRGRALVIEYPADLHVDVERIPITDDRLRESWADAVHRIVLLRERPARAGSTSLRMTPLEQLG